MALVRTERGWCAHFIGGRHCLYRRNTLLSDGTLHIVVSTVGAYTPRNKVEEIGFDRYYETMAFVGRRGPAYIDANVSEQVNFTSERWCISTITDDVDNVADAMHESNVAAIAADFINLWRQASKDGE